MEYAFPIENLHFILIKSRGVVISSKKYFIVIPIDMKLCIYVLNFILI